MTLTHSEEKKVFSRNMEYAVGYCSTDMGISLYSKERVGYVYHQTLFKHKHPIIKVLFIDDNHFVSLDSKKIIKIWNIYSNYLRVCQTISPNLLKNKKVIDISVHDCDSRQIKVESENAYDVYCIAVKEFRYRRPNQLLYHLKTIRKKKENEMIKETVSYSHKEKRIGGSFEGLKPRIKKERKSGKRDKIPKKQLEVPLSTLTLNRDNSSIENNELSDFGLSFDSPKHYIGFDMGTSRSKICYLKEGEPQRNVEIMTFGQKGADNNNISYESWVLPTVAAVIGNRIEYGYDALDYPKENRYYDLKKSLLDSNLENREEITMLAAGYVAYVYEKCRETILENMNQPGMRVEDLQCQMSICVPVTQIDDDKSIEYLTRFRQLAEHACRNNTYFDYNKMCEDKSQIFNSNLVNDLPEFIDMVPEVVAEIRGYHIQKIAESISMDKRNTFNNYALISRKTGSSIYAIYDLGAGTTDLSIMSLNIDSDVSNRDGVRRGGKIYQTKIIYRGFSDIKNHHDETEVIQFYNDVLEELRGVWTDFYHDNFEDRTGRMEYINNAVICMTGGGAECAAAGRVFRKIPFYKAVDEYEITDKLFVLNGPNFWDAENKFPPYHRFGVSFGLTDDPRSLNYLYELPSKAEAYDNIQKQKELSEEEIEEHRKHFIG